SLHVFLRRIEYVGRGFAFDDEISGKATLDARQRMIDEDISPRHLTFDLDRDRAPGGHRHGLHAFERRAHQRAELVDLVEDFPDHVERGGEVWAADAEIDAYRLADIGV